MGFPYAAIAALGARARPEARDLVLVPQQDVQHAASTALLAAGRIRERNLAAAVAARLMAARAHNARWYAVGPLRASEDEDVIARELQRANPLDDDEWFLLDLPTRLLEAAAYDAGRAPARGDGMVLLDADAWGRLAIYGPGRPTAGRLVSEPLAA